MKGTDGEGEVLRRMIAEELEKCEDIDLLDLVYKLLVE